MSKAITMKPRAKCACGMGLSFGLLEKHEYAHHGRGGCVTVVGNLDGWHVCYYLRTKEGTVVTRYDMPYSEDFPRDTDLNGPWCDDIQPCGAVVAGLAHNENPRERLVV